MMTLAQSQQLYLLHAVGPSTHYLNGKLLASHQMNTSPVKLQKFLLRKLDHKSIRSNKLEDPLKYVNRIHKDESKQAQKENKQCWDHNKQFLIKLKTYNTWLVIYD